MIIHCFNVFFFVLSKSLHSDNCIQTTGTDLALCQTIDGHRCPVFLRTSSFTMRSGYGSTPKPLFVTFFSRKITGLDCIYLIIERLKYCDLSP